jgi:hypothetical protein
MNLHYKIVEVWPNDHLIVVRYWTDVVTEEHLAHPGERRPDGSPWRCRSDVSITLPLPTPTDEKLEQIILRQAPLAWLKMLEAVVDPNVDTEMKGVQNLLGKTFTKEAGELYDFNPNQQDFDIEIKKLIESLNTDETK